MKCACGKPMSFKARKCAACRTGAKSHRPGWRQMTPAMKEALRRVLAKREA